MIHMPNLVSQRFLQANQPFDFLFKRSNGHCVGHSDSKGMVKGKFLLDILEVGVPKKEASSGMVALKRSDIKDEIVMNKNDLSCPLSVLPNLLKVFEYEIVV